MATHDVDRGHRRLGVIRSWRQASDSGPDYKALVPQALERLYAVALTGTASKTMRLNALEDLLAFGFERPESSEPDLYFQPRRMSIKTRTKLEAMVSALKKDPER
jgi:hypothetical protein